MIASWSDPISNPSSEPSPGRQEIIKTRVLGSGQCKMLICAGREGERERERVELTSLNISGGQAH